jgi:sulfide:quinone oxidoreductase
MIIDHLLQNKGSRAEASIDIYSPAPIALPVAGAQISSMLVEMLGQRGINFHQSRKVESVTDNELVFGDGTSTKYQVLVGIPPHRVPTVISASGLTGPSGWIEVDKRTLRISRKNNNVFAIGDVTEIKATSSISVPKAGIFAEAQAKVVAQEIIDELSGRQSMSTFDGRGYCFMESGGQVAGLVEASFFEDSGPHITLDASSERNYEKKQEFERVRIRDWLL